MRLIKAPEGVEDADADREIRVPEEEIWRPEIVQADDRIVWIVDRDTQRRHHVVREPLPHGDHDDSPDERREEKEPGGWEKRMKHRQPLLAASDRRECGRTSVT